MERRRLLTGASLIVVLTVALDQLSKWWALETLAPDRTVSLLPTLEFDLAYNSGFSFGTGAGLGPWIGILVIGLIGFLGQKIYRSTAWPQAFLLATILGGAIGNLLDRIFRASDGLLSGKVIDFIDVEWYAVFNVADMFVVCGCIAYVLYELRQTRDETMEPIPQRAVLRHRRGSRWMHWINFPLIVIMVWSGFRIYWAEQIYAFGLLDWEWFKFLPAWINEPLGFERRLARGLAFHFSFAWLFVLNGLAYGVYVWRTGGWREIIPTRRELKQCGAVVMHDLGLRKDAPAQDGHYNAAQKLTYTVVIGLGGLALLTGFALFKPTQLSFLTALFGGYTTARLIHFWVCVSFVGFFVVHILQVIRAGRSNFTAMVTGYEVVEDEAHG